MPPKPEVTRRQAGLVRLIAGSHAWIGEQ